MISTNSDKRIICFAVLYWILPLSINQYIVDLRFTVVHIIHIIHVWHTLYVHSFPLILVNLVFVTNKILAFICSNNNCSFLFVFLHDVYIMLHPYLNEHWSLRIMFPYYGLEYYSLRILSFKSVPLYLCFLKLVNNLWLSLSSYCVGIYHNDSVVNWFNFG